jgi:hypothetical protein
VGSILKACGWSRQKPVQRVTQRDEEAIRRWRKVRTYAPVGQTPIIRAPLS